jgi:tetratricopeptide (TPR) repeat protein
MAARYYEESFVGEDLPAVTERFARFLLDYHPERAEEVERLFDQVLEQEPNYNLAIIGKAYCIWARRQDLEGARRLIEDYLEKFPKDERGLGCAVHLSLAADSLDSAENWFSRLARTKGVSEPAMSELRGFLALCRGLPLEEAIGLLQQMANDASAINIAAVKWCQGNYGECRNILTAITPEILHASARVEYVAVRSLAEDTQRDIHRAKFREFLPNESFILTDPTLLRALARHPDVRLQDRRRLSSVLDFAMTWPRSP